MNDQKLTSLEEITTARMALPAFIRLTPVLPFARSSMEIGREQLSIKCENLQVTGAYKIRAACNLLRSLDAVQRARGVVLTSSGNFAQAFAYAGREMGVPICVVMLDDTSDYKVAATQDHGAEVVLCGTDAMERQPTVDRIAKERQMTGINTWEERPIIAGHASIGLEILEQSPDVEQVLVPVSSGGVAAGVATAIKLSQPGVRVIGVQPERANAAYVSRQAGEPTAIDYWDSIADGLSARRPGEFPFAHLQQYLDDIVLVTERDIGCAFVELMQRSKLLAEAAGAVATAGFVAGRIDTSLRTIAVVTGGNLTTQSMQELQSLASLPV